MPRTLDQCSQSFAMASCASSCASPGSPVCRVSSPTILRDAASRVRQLRLLVAPRYGSTTRGTDPRFTPPAAPHRYPAPAPPSRCKTAVPRPILTRGRFSRRRSRLAGAVLERGAKEVRLAVDVSAGPAGRLAVLGGLPERRARSCSGDRVGQGDADDGEAEGASEEAGEGEVPCDLARCASGEADDRQGWESDGG